MRHIRILLFIFSGVFLVTCAKQGYPPGGPVDKRPPYVVSAIPAMDSTNVAVDTKIELVFSEQVDHNSCESAIFITPFPGENIKYKWKGKKLKIEFSEPLALNRTYIITIGTGTKDLRNNTMKASYTLAFSTGAELDVAIITGNVYGTTGVAGTQVWAYDLKETPDPNPAEHFPLYITQVGDDGVYELTHMAWGNYRLLAVNDRDMNNRYDAEFDYLGVSNRDLLLTPEQSAVKNINFQIALRDTTPPLLRAASAVDRNHVELRFSEKMATDSLENPLNYLLCSQTDTLAVIDAYYNILNPAVVNLTTEEQAADSVYFVTVLTARDLTGFTLGSDTLSVSFKGSAKPDTLGAGFMTMQPADSAQNVLVTTKLDMYFSETLNKASLEKFFSLGDTVGNVINGVFTWHNGAHFTFAPSEPLQKETLYLAQFPVDSVLDYFGNSYADTMFVKRFITVNPDTLSDISGTVSDEDSAATGAFFLQAGAEKGPIYERWADKEGKYLFDNILPGIYKIKIYRDSDGNKSYTYGEAWPFKPADRVYMYPDSINVRSRWANEGNDIVFPR